MSGKGRNMTLSREPQWSAEEIKLFFQEFQKFPMQWNLIASKIKGRDSSMVQALYTMNKSYLSLKDATAEGLILVMKDRYDNASELERQVLLQSSKRRTPQSSRRTPKKVKPSPLRQIIESTSYTSTPPNPISKRKRKPSPLYDRHNQPPTSPYKGYSTKLAYMSPSVPISSPLITGTIIGSPQPMNSPPPSNTNQSSSTNLYNPSIAQYTNQLCNCLSMKMRFWCFYEWYYSTIDRDYFRRNEFKSYLRTKGLQDITHLTRREWSLLRSYMGVPRRMSKKFFDQERTRLEQYRQNCCALMMKRPPMYADESVYPSIVPQPILVGQYVTAIHPIYKTICNGTVLTSDTYNGNYQIQFDNAKYGVHLCNITDIITFPNTNSTNYDAEVAKYPSLYQTLSKATILLDRKEAIIRQICKMNNEFANQLIQKNSSTIVIYNWLLFNLNETNIILQSVMNDVISFADSSQLSSNCVVNDLLFTCQNSSKLVIKNMVKELHNEYMNDEITKILPSESELDEIFIKPREPENPQIYRLILNCITLLLGMKTAVERDGIPNSTISNLIETSLKEIEPINDESQAIFKTISELIYRFKSYCVHEEIVLPISPSRSGRNDLASLPRTI